MPGWEVAPIVMPICLARPAVSDRCAFGVRDVPVCDMPWYWHWWQWPELPRVGEDEEVGYDRNVVHNRGRRQLYRWSLR
jgi:hypothetical protein